MFSGAPDRAPLPGDSWVPPGASSSASPAGVLFFTPLLSQDGAQRQAFRLSFSLFFFFLFWCILARSLGFYIASDFDYLLIYQDSSINSFAPFSVSSV